MGSAAMFAGFALSRVDLTLTRGFQASLSHVELFVAGWGEGFLVRGPHPDEQLPKQGAEDAALAIAAAEGKTALPVPTRASLPFSGWVTWAEIEDGKQWTGSIGPFYVVNAEEIDRSADGAMSRVRLTLADQRFRWGDGALRRWSFNRLTAAGFLAPDSLQIDRGGAFVPFSGIDVAREIVSSLRGSPVLERAPSRLGGVTGPFEATPYAPALPALVDLASRHSLEDPCLTWAGHVELYDPGEVAARGNELHGLSRSELPPELNLWLEGAGLTHQVEIGYPSDYVLVRGGERIATAAVDGWEPVLQLGDATYVPLNEASLAKLGHDLAKRSAPPGEAKTWMEWLHTWLLVPPAYQATWIGEPMAEILDQAYRLFRLPGAAPLEDGTPGHNSHLLPLLPRAEVQGDRRLPVTVETYYFAPAHVAFTGQSELNQRLAAARSSRERARQAIQRAADLANVRDPFESQVITPGANLLSMEAVRRLTGDLGGLSLDGDGLNAMVGEARGLAGASDLNSDLAATYERALREILEVEDRDRDLLLDAAKLVVAAERRAATELGDLAQVNLFQAGVAIGRRGGNAVRASLDGTEGGLAIEIGKLEALRLQVAAQIKDLLLEHARRGQDRMNRRLAGVPRAGEEETAIYIHENLPRGVGALSERDPQARVHDAQAGVIETSRLAGWLTTPQRTDLLAAAPFIPKPVRVLFGTHVRPRRDEPGSGPRVASGRAQGREDVIPTALSDEGSWFIAAFKRGQDQSAVPIDWNSLPTVERERIRDRARVILAPELVELVPLPLPQELLSGIPGAGAAALAQAEALKIDGGNRNALAKAAHELARGPVHASPLIRGDRAVFARPHKVRLDGVIAQVTIRSRPDFEGFETEITTGSSEGALNPYRTVVRRPPANPADGKRREGFAP